MSLADFFKRLHPARRHYAAARAAEAAGHPAEALRLYERAAAAGSGPAYYRLGEIYRDGRLGQPLDWGRAVDAFLDAGIAREAEPAGSAALDELLEAGLLWALTTPPEAQANAAEASAEVQRMLDDWDSQGPLDPAAPASDDDAGTFQIPMKALQARLADWEARGWLDRVPAPPAGANLAKRRAQLATAAESGDGAAAWEVLRLALDGRWGPAEDNWLRLQLFLALVSDAPPAPALALASVLLPAEEADGWREVLQEQARAGNGEAALWLKRLAA